MATVTGSKRKVDLELNSLNGRDIEADGAKLDSIDVGATNNQTVSPSEALTAIKTVDGSGSGLDADVLDGQHGSYYTGYTDTAIANLIDSSPAALDTLNELAAALGDDPNFATTVTNSIGTKLPKSGGSMTGHLSFGDMDKATFGSGSDLQIYHSGSASYVHEQGTGDLRIRGSEVRIEDGDGSTIALFKEDAGAQLRYNGSIKFDIKSNGARIGSGGSGEYDNLSFLRYGGAEVGAIGWHTDAKFYIGGHPNYGATAGNGVRVYGFGSDLHFGDNANGDVVTVSAADGSVLVNGANSNGGKADFAVDAKGDPQISLHSNQIQMGGTDMNWNSKFYYDGATNIGGWNNNINLFSYGGTTSRDIILAPSLSGVSTERFRLKGSTGYVGINTDNPYNRLHVNGTGRINSLMVGDANATNTPAVALHIKSSATNARLRIEDSDAGNDYWDFYVNQGDGLHFQEDGVNRVTFKTGGNVGIGTSSPEQALHVNGTLLLENNKEIRFKDSGGSQRTALELDSSNNLYLGTSAGGNLIFVNGSSYTERMRINSNGRLGIGTTSPAYNLVVSDGGASGIEFGPAYSGTANLIQHYSRSGATYVDGVQDAAQHRFNLSGSEAMRISNSGNVGIGTSSPKVPFHTVGPSARPVSLAEFDTASTAQFQSDSATASSLYIAEGNSHDQILQVTDGATNSSIAGDLLLNPYGGNVGIGHTSPTAPLDVRAGLAGSPVAHLKNAGGFGIKITPQIGGSGGVTDIGLASGESLSFSPNNAERMRIDSSGNVGIGATSPTYRLQVLAETGAQDIFLAGQAGVSNGYTISSNGTNLTHRWYHSGSEAMRIGSNGTLGVGVTDGSSTFSIDTAKGIRSRGTLPNFTMRETDASNQEWQMGSYSGDWGLRDITGGSYPILVSDGAPDNSIKISGTGYVGINTGSPAASLHVESQGAALRLQNNNSDTNGVFLDFRKDSGTRSGYVGTTGSGDDISLWNSLVGSLRFATNNSERMRINSSGNVGIGTTSFSSSLAVQSSAAPTFNNDTHAGESIFVRGSATSGDGNAQAVVAFGKADGSSRRSGAAIASVQTNSDADRVGLGFYTSPSSSSSQTMSQAMLINHAGNVGIGTANPSELLHLNGGVNDATGIIIGNNNSTRVRLYHNDAAGASYLSTDGVGTEQKLHIRSGATLHFDIGSSEAMRIDENGNVLVGTTGTSVANQTGTTEGVRLAPSNVQAASVGITAYFNRLSTDGDIVEFRRSGSTVGSIGVDNSDNLVIEGNATHAGLQFGTSTILPHQDGALADDTINLGNASQRFNDLHLSGNVNVGGTVDGRNVSNDGTKLDGIESGATADQTAAQILTAVKTVDGSGSGLDADKLDGLQGTDFQKIADKEFFSITNSGTTSGTWLGSHSDITSYFDGMTIAFYQNNIAGANTTTININSLGAKTIYYANNSKLTTHYGSRSLIMLQYDADQDRFYAHDFYYSDANYTTRWSNDVTAGAYVHGSQLLLEGADGKFYPVTEGGSTGNTNTVSTAELRVGGTILWYISGTDYAADATITSSSLYTSLWASSMEYWNNRDSGWATARRDVYLVCTQNSNGNFVLDNTSYTSFMTQDLPTSDDGKFYLKIGIMHDTYDDFRLQHKQPIYVYKDGKIKEYSGYADYAGNADKLDGVQLSSLYLPYTSSEISDFGSNRRVLSAWTSSGDIRWYLAPRNAGDTAWEWSDEFGYNQTQRKWYAEGGFAVTGNITLSGTVDGRDVATDGTKLDGIETGATADQTAAQILTAIKTVDGSGSGLDADKLDGLSSSDFWRRTSNTGATVGPGWVTVASTAGNRYQGEVVVADAESGDHAYVQINWLRSYQDSNFTVLNTGGHANRITGARVLYDTSNDTYGTKYLQVYVTASSYYHVYIHKAGSLSGWGNLTSVTPVLENTKTGYAVHGYQLDNLDTYGFAAEEGILAGGFIRSNSGMSVDGNTVWHAGNDGSGSGLDADKLDGLQASQFLRSDAADTMTSQLTMSGTSPQIKFNDTDADDFWIHVNGNTFYVLTDRDDSGGWDGTYPLQLNNSNSTGYLYGERLFANNYHPNADKLTTARNIALAGDVTGSANFDGTGNISINATVANDSHSHAFNNLSSKTSGTGDYSTSGDLVSGRGSGGVALTINDGYGNSNVTFNHQNGVPEQTGNAGRIEVNTDGTTNANMNIELGTNKTGGVATGLTTAANFSQEDQTFYYSGSPKLATTSTGMAVTGNITVSGNVDGRDVAVDGATLDDIESNVNSGVFFKIPAGGSGGTVSLADLVPADGSSDNYTVAKIAATEIILDGTIQAEQMNLDRLSALSADLGAVTVSELMRMPKTTSAFMAGKTSVSDYAQQGFHLGRVDRGLVTAGSFVVDRQYQIVSVGTTDFEALGAVSNEVGVSFITSGVGSGTGTAKLVGYSINVTSIDDQGQLSGLVAEDGKSLAILNPKFYKGGSATGATQDFLASGSTNLGVNEYVDIEAIAGGGAGGYGLHDSSTTGSAASGTNTQFSLRIGSATGTVIKSWNLQGGLGGTNANIHPSYGGGKEGEASSFGEGGAAGGVVSSDNDMRAGGNAVGLGAGGGGASADWPQTFDATGYGGGKGFAGEYAIETVDTTAAGSSDVWLVIDQVGAGATNAGGSAHGGEGGDGLVRVSAALVGMSEMSISTGWEDMGEIWNQASDGNVQWVETPDLEDGYNYAFNIWNCKISDNYSWYVGAYMNGNVWRIVTLGAANNSNHHNTGWIEVQRPTLTNSRSLIIDVITRENAGGYGNFDIGDGSDMSNKVYGKPVDEIPTKLKFGSNMTMSGNGATIRLYRRKT